jgi:hypothetical protein
MPLQNRVTPDGDIVALPGRGMMMGNRGILHDDSRRIVRSMQCKRWIACVLEFRGIRRAVMTPHHYTELFFLDEATAFAAGHRPCAECRRADYKRFQALWQQCFGGKPDANSIDAVLHAERLQGRTKRKWRAAIETLPDGTYVVNDGAAHVLWRDELLAWSDAGYGHRKARPEHGEVDILTPPSIVAIFTAGYVPGVHPTVRPPGGHFGRAPERRPGVG